MTENEHLKIFDKHQDILISLDKKLDKLDVRFENSEKKLDSLESRLNLVTSFHTNDLSSIKVLFKTELDKIDFKVETKLEKVNDKITEMERFQNKIYGVVFALSGAFAVITFLINKFV